MTVGERFLGVGILLLTAGGCMGSRAYVHATELKYPVSLSSAVRAPDGAILTEEGNGIEKVGTFRLDYTTCRMLWTLIPIKSANRDISDEVNEQIPRKGGEAIINLSVESSSTVWTAMTIVGVLPDCGKVRIRGDIVSRVQAPPAAVPEPPAPVGSPTPATPATTTPGPTSENTP